MAKKYVSFVPVRNSAPAVPGVAHSPSQRAEVFLACSLLLSYPGLHWQAALAEIRQILPGLPAEPAKALGRFVDWAEASGQEVVEQTYVTTFDQKRRCSLELTYYATGDTRQRGIALTVFRDLYAAVGWEPVHNDLPDHLPAVLELAARCSGEELSLVEDTIAAHREGIEVLHAALSDIGSPWADVVAALRAALPEIDEQTYLRMQELVRKGPPSELVGLSDRQLPWPTVPGADRTMEPITAGAEPANSDNPPAAQLPREGN